MYEYLELVENPRKKRKKRTYSAPASAGMGLSGLVLAGGLTYAIWALIKKSPTPWKSKIKPVPIGRRSVGFSEYEAIFKAGNGGVLPYVREPLSPVVDRSGNEHPTVFETWK